MTAQGKPYSPETLADRWGCSAQKVRNMYHAGELVGFQLGKLIRIPAVEVERIECQNIALQCTEESSLSHGTSLDGSTRDESRLARLTAPRPKVSLVKSGPAFKRPKASG